MCILGATSAAKRGKILSGISGGGSMYEWILGALAIPAVAFLYRSATSENFDYPKFLSAAYRVASEAARLSAAYLAGTWFAGEKDPLSSVNFPIWAGIMALGATYFLAYFVWVFVNTFKR